MTLAWHRNVKSCHGVTILFVRFLPQLTNTPASGSQQATQLSPGLLRLLSATTAKSISEVKPSNKRGAHHLVHVVRENDRFKMADFTDRSKTTGLCYFIISYIIYPEGKKQKKRPALLLVLRAVGETRTRTGLLPLPPQSSVSTISPPPLRWLGLQRYDKKLNLQTFL